MIELHHSWHTMACVSCHLHWNQINFVSSLEITISVHYIDKRYIFLLVYYRKYIIELFIITATYARMEQHFKNLIKANTEIDTYWIWIGKLTIFGMHHGLLALNDLIVYMFNESYCHFKFNIWIVLFKLHSKTYQYTCISAYSLFYIFIQKIISHGESNFNWYMLLSGSDKPLLFFPLKPSHYFSGWIISTGNRSRISTREECSMGDIKQCGRRPLLCRFRIPYLYQTYTAGTSLTSRCVC